MTGSCWPPELLTGNGLRAADQTGSPVCERLMTPNLSVLNSLWAVVISTGFIGLDLAAEARKHGIEVTAPENADRPMARADSVAGAV